MIRLLELALERKMIFMTLHANFSLQTEGFIIMSLVSKVETLSTRFKQTLYLL